MRYDISGDFIEACDCFVVCPCWVDDDPDGGSCTGLFAWTMADGSRIDDVDVSGRTVVSISSHAGNRRGGRATTALYVDQGAGPEQFSLLTQAFSGELDGPLADLAAVSGAVLVRQLAAITVDPGGGGVWHVSVVAPTGTGTGTTAENVPLVVASGEARVFDHEDTPMTLRHTALSHELGVPFAGEVVAQGTQTLQVHVAALPGGYLEVAGRSGMRGSFAYRQIRSSDG